MVLGGFVGLGLGVGVLVGVGVGVGVPVSVGVGVGVGDPSRQCESWSWSRSSPSPVYVTYASLDSVTSVEESAANEPWPFCVITYVAPSTVSVALSIPNAGASTQWAPPSHGRFSDPWPVQSMTPSAYAGPAAIRSATVAASAAMSFLIPLPPLPPSRPHALGPRAVQIGRAHV